MIILFEGPDRSGKTTIAKEFAKRHNYFYFKHQTNDNFFYRTQRINEIIEGYFLVDFLSQVSIDLVLDRHIPSEFVYSIVYHRPLDCKKILDIDDKLATIGTFMIYCEKTQYPNFNDIYVDEESIRDIIKVYKYYLLITHIPTLVLDTTNEDLESQIQNINKFLFKETL